MMVMKFTNKTHRSKTVLVEISGSTFPDGRSAGCSLLGSSPAAASASWTCSARTRSVIR